MESFILLREGTTPCRLRADHGDLRNDGLGRGGFTVSTANTYRRHDSTVQRRVGPLQPTGSPESSLALIDVGQ